jgi:hypothetical protein
MDVVIDHAAHPVALVLRGAELVASRRGVSEAEIIREGIHLAAIGNRIWDEEFDWPVFDGPGTPAAKSDVTRTIAKAVTDR